MKNNIRQFSIKAKILQIIILVLILSLIGHLGIFYYNTVHVKKISQTAMAEIFDFENKANRELKDSLAIKFVVDDVLVYSNIINRKVGTKYYNNVKSPGFVKKIKRIINLEQVIESEKNRPGYMFIIDKTGEVIAIEGLAEEVFYKNKFSIKKKLLQSDDKIIVKLIQKILQSPEDYGVFIEKINKSEYLFLFSKIKTINCILIKALPEVYLNRTVELMAERIDAFIDKIKSKFISLYNRINILTLAVFITIIIIAYFIGSSLARSITVPLVKLKEATKYIGRGDLVNKIEINTGDEIEQLADNFNLMTSDLKVYINRLSESISREKAIEEEIKLAAHIQTSSLPEGHPQFKPGTGVDLSAYIQPTKIISGDFYDYFFIDANHLFFAIGDVSGKSISAALFMMTTKILMKKFALSKLPPDEILKNVNDTMALDNPKCMYSTVFCGILDIKTGHLRYCNGGHTYPLMSDGTIFKYLNTEENMLVGLTSKAEFKSQTLDLRENNILFIYTDGVTESKDKDDQIYSEEQLLEKLNKADKMSSESLINWIKDDLQAFSKDTEQYDDITMLCIRFSGEI